MIKKDNKSDGDIFMLAFWFVLLVAIVLFAFWQLYLFSLEQPSGISEPTNTTVINNYYCNISEPIPDGVYVQDYLINETTHEVENITCAKANQEPHFFTPSPTPTPWNDTRRESVGLPADGYMNPCCPHCTPTPTPACEFPWWCR